MTKLLICLLLLNLNFALCVGGADGGGGQIYLSNGEIRLLDNKIFSKESPISFINHWLHKSILDSGSQSEFYFSIEEKFECSLDRLNNYFDISPIVTKDITFTTQNLMSLFIEKDKLFFRKLQKYNKYPFILFPLVGLNIRGEIYINSTLYGFLSQRDSCVLGIHEILRTMIYEKNKKSTKEFSFTEDSLFRLAIFIFNPLNTGYTGNIKQNRLYNYLK